MGKPVARLKDVAERTGFSVNTVSLALRNSPRIPLETRKLIKQMAEELNYLPNDVARSLVAKETKSIGLILTDLENPVLTHVAQSIELALARNGYTTLLATSNNNLEEEMRMIEVFSTRRADGMLIFPCSHRRLDHIRLLRSRNYPVVLLVGDPNAGIDAVSMDEQSGAYKAVSHLIAIGHRRIALIDGAAILGNTEKQTGYLQAHAEAGAAVDTAFFIDPKGHSVEYGYWAMAALMERSVKPTAIFATNDSLALGVLRYCSKHRIKVPDEISIIGFDNIEFGEFAVTSLSTVDYDVKRVSELAVNRIIELIAVSGDLPEPRIIQVEPDLLIRESSSRPLNVALPNPAPKAE